MATRLTYTTGSRSNSDVLRRAGATTGAWPGIQFAREQSRTIVQ